MTVVICQYRETSYESENGSLIDSLFVYTQQTADVFVFEQLFVCAYRMCLAVPEIVYYALHTQYAYYRPAYFFVNKQ